ncbi:LOW protein: PPR containing-like protein [Perilla frutescens var. hirtella]|nr:LOW protein: PPR containing-like protein [Perilla frutescens var. hirtella]
MRSLKEGLKFHAHAVKSGFLPRIITTNQLIDLYSKHGLTSDAHKLFDGMPDRNVFSWNTIINAYIRSRNLPKAKDLFDSSPLKDSITYNLMISGYARSDGCERDAIELFIQMQFEEDGARIDEFTLTTMLNLLAKLRVLRYGVQVHSFMVKSGNDQSGFSLSSLIDMYSKCGNFWDACRVVNGQCGKGMVDCVVKNALLAACCREGKMEIAREIFFNDPELNDDVSWNTMISGCAQNGLEEEAVELFKCMAKEGFRWNEHTFASLLAACSALKSLKLGKEVHAWVLKDGTCLNPFISSGIVDIYSKCGDMRSAENVLRRIGMSNIFAINSMIVRYSARGEMAEARKLFDSVAERNFVMWTAIISGYVKLQKCEDAFVLFHEYASEEMTVPDAVILVSMLGACAVQASVDPGKQIHAYMLRIGITMDAKAISALIDMYSKCGFILHARRLFERVSIRDTIMYNVMISGCAHHGFEQDAIHLFEEMIGRGLHPDAVTFIALLSACRHGGLVEAGENYFLSMSKDYAIPPEIDHYACMVDLYGRANQLEKAVSFMEKMPIEPNSVILSAFLTACRTNKNLELAKMAEDKLLEIDGDNGSRYFQLASVYASGGKWDEKGRVMRTMRGKEVKKLAGCSWIQLGNGVHSFTSGDRSHSEAMAIYSTLGCLINELYDKVGVDLNTKLLSLFSPES